MKRCILLFSKDYESQVNHKYIVVCMNGLIDVLMVYVPVRGDIDIPISHYFEQLMADTNSYYQLILELYCSVIS